MKLLRILAVYLLIGYIVATLVGLGINVVKHAQSGFYFHKEQVERIENWFVFVQMGLLSAGALTMFLNLFRAVRERAIWRCLCFVFSPLALSGWLLTFYPPDDEILFAHLRDAVFLLVQVYFYLRFTKKVLSDQR